MKYLWLVCFVGCVWGANWALGRYGIVDAPLYSVPAGVFFAGLTFTVRDLLREAGNRWWVVAAILIGATLSFLLEDAQKFAVASGVAFLISETADSLVYEPLRRRWWLAVPLSNAVGLVLDSLLFLWLAFGSLDFWEGQVFYKALMTVLAILVLGAIRELPRRRAA